MRSAGPPISGRIRWVPLEDRLERDVSPNAATFPLLRFVRNHIFESAALAVTLIGTCAYGIGMSIYDGWSEMAGVPVSYFQPSVYETVRKGLSEPKPWLFMGIAGIVILVLLFGANAWEMWFRQRKMSRERMRLAQSARQERLYSETSPRNTGPRSAAWRKLGRRGAIDVAVHVRKSAQHSRRRAFVLETARALMPIGFFVFSLIIYNFFYVFAISTARAEGMRSYLSVYVAVTGKFPAARASLKPTLNDLLSHGCAGVRRLENYVAVHLPPSESRMSSAAYILEVSADNFVLLGPDGLILEKFGDAGYHLSEAGNRPLSAIIRSCPSSH